MAVPDRSGRDSRGDETLIACLAAGWTQAEAASAAGVSQRTVRRRMQEVVFLERLANARNAKLRQALGQLSHASTKAAETLLDLAESAESEMARLGAARAIIALAVDLRESEELAGRLEDLERAIGMAP